MSTGDTLIKTGVGGGVGALKGAGLAVFGTAAVAGLGGLAIGISLAVPALAVTALVLGGAVLGGIFGFSVLAPLFSFIGGAFGAAKGARQGTEQSQLEKQQQYEMMREQQMLMQRQQMMAQGACPPAGADCGSDKSFTQQVEQERINNANCEQSR